MINVKLGGKTILLNNYGKINPESIDDYINNNGYNALKKALNLKPEEIVEEVKKANLRGRGGAGFPTGVKWGFTARLEGEKYIVCNADEGEPGTVKDRIIMENDPHKLIEGMIISAYAIGAQKGYIYVRGEYEKSIKLLNKAIKDAKDRGFLGKNILGSKFDFELEVKKGAGAYVCGEETSLINSIEGKRGYPRIKPPFPGISGLWEKPTVVNNVETLSNISAIIENGAEWFKGFGTEESSGTRIFILSGDINNPCVIEEEMGITLKDLIDKYGKGVKGNFKAAQVGGAAGYFFGKDMLDVPLSYEGVAQKNKALGSGAVLVINDKRDIKPLLNNILEFFEHESCGQCFPCRLGTKMLTNLMKKVNDNRNADGHYQKMLELSVAMKEASLCALGQSPFMPISSAYEYFKDEIIG